MFTGGPNHGLKAQIASKFGKQLHSSAAEILCDTALGIHWGVSGRQFGTPRAEYWVWENVLWGMIRTHSQCVSKNLILEYDASKSMPHLKSFQIDMYVYKNIIINIM